MTPQVTQSIADVANTAYSAGEAIGKLWLAVIIIVAAIILIALVFAIIKICLLASIKTQMQNANQKLDILIDEKRKGDFKI